MKVQILKTDKTNGVKKGETYYAEPYHGDPKSKVTLLSRCSDGFEPNCNQYRTNVKIIPQNDFNREFLSRPFGFDLRSM